MNRRSTPGIRVEHVSVLRAHILHEFRSQLDFIIKGESCHASRVTKCDSLPDLAVRIPDGHVSRVQWGSEQVGVLPAFHQIALEYAHHAIERLAFPVLQHLFATVDACVVDGSANVGGASVDVQLRVVAG